jgi:hypothetical protein
MIPPIGYYICHTSNVDRAGISTHASIFSHAKEGRTEKKEKNNNGRTNKGPCNKKRLNQSGCRLDACSVAVRRAKNGFTPVLITTKKCTSAQHYTAGCVVSNFVLIKLNFTAFAQPTLILYNSKKRNVLFVYIHTYTRWI